MLALTPALALAQDAAQPADDTVAGSPIPKCSLDAYDAYKEMLACEDLDSGATNAVDQQDCRTAAQAGAIIHACDYRRFLWLKNHPNQHP